MDRERRLARLFSPCQDEDATSEEEDGLLTPVGAAQDLEEQVRREQASLQGAREQDGTSSGGRAGGRGTGWQEARLEAGSRSPGNELRTRQPGGRTVVDIAASEDEDTEVRRGQELKDPGSRKKKTGGEEAGTSQKRKRNYSPEKVKGKKASKKAKKAKGKKKDKEERRKGKKRKMADSSSTESEMEDASSSSSGSDTGSSSSSSQSSDSSSSEGQEGSGLKELRRRKKKGKKARKKKEKEDDWQLLAEMWPLEARPARLQDKKVVARWSIGKIMEFKKQYEMEAERQGVGVAVFGRDKKRRAKRYKAMKDNGEDRLHPARFERMPFSDPTSYWPEVPVKREEIYRHVKLDLYGAQGQVSEATIVRLHDRRVPVDLDMFTRNSLAREIKGADRMTEVVDTRHLQEAVANYSSIMQVLWPLDYGPAVIHRVLIDARWGEMIAEDKLRTAVVKRFFAEVVRENCGRAVRREVPMVYKEAKEKWNQIVENYVPQADRVSNLGSRGAAGGGNSGQGGNGGGGKASGGQKNSGKGHSKLRPNRPIAMVQGIQVCYGFNEQKGCQRPLVRANVCKDVKNNSFAHVCNWWENGTGKYCLQAHPRTGNH